MDSTNRGDDPMKNDPVIIEVTFDTLLPIVFLYMEEHGMLNDLLIRFTNTEEESK